MPLPTITGTVGVGAFTGVSTSGGLDILGTISGGGNIILGEPYWTSGTLDFIPFDSTFTSNPVTLNTASIGAFTLPSTLGSFNGQASLGALTSALIGVTGSAASGSETAEYYIVGNFAVAGATAASYSSTTNATGGASMTLTFGETCNATIAPCGPGNLGTINAEITLAAPANSPPPPPSAPEPASLTLLGAGLLGLGAVRRRFRKV
jgi:hypothetical protein